MRYSLYFILVEEKKLVDEVFNNAMDVLSEQDRTLPQVENVKPLLRRGIGIHHGGTVNYSRADPAFLVDGKYMLFTRQ